MSEHQEPARRVVVERKTSAPSDQPIVRPQARRLELVLSLVRRDLKARYKESTLGFFWSLLRPAFLTLVLWLVFAVLLPVPFETPGVPAWLHILISVLTWNFVFGSITDATHSILANGNLLKKVPLDATVFPVASVLSNGVHFALAMAVALPLAAVAGRGVSITAVLYLPVVILIAALFALGLGLVLAALNVFYRDTGSALELMGMAWFYATPVIYPASLAHKGLAKYAWAGTDGDLGFAGYMLNPAAPLLVAVRRVTVYGRVGPAELEISDLRLAAHLVIVLTVSALLLTIARVAFRKYGRLFSDEL